MSVDEIRPGMVGVGRTVFDGTRVEEFRARILGVIENVIGARRNLILARLEGGPLANTGVIAGMSGSPVYIDGRLIGAVSYALGAFSKEPIAGITPIAEMTDATSLTNSRPRAARVQLDFPLTDENLVAAFRRALNWNRPFAERPGDARFVGISARRLCERCSRHPFPPDRDPACHVWIRAGRRGSCLARHSAIKASFRLAEVPAGRRAGEMPFEGPLKPGDAVGVGFLNGDLEMGATGTVTHIDGDRVYAFGHPMYNLGPTEFPMTRAYVYTVLPSLARRLKLSTTGEVIGTFLQDRATAIAGRLGPGPRMIPITLTLESDRGPQAHVPLRCRQRPALHAVDDLRGHSRHARLVRAAERGRDLQRARQSRGEEARRHRLLRTCSPATRHRREPPATWSPPITYLMANDYEKVELEGLEFTMSTSEEPKTATLQRVWLDDPRPRAGRTVPLKVSLRTFRGEEVVRTLPVAIPANATRHRCRSWSPMARGWRRPNSAKRDCRSSCGACRN